MKNANFFVTRTGFIDAVNTLDPNYFFLHHKYNGPKQGFVLMRLIRPLWFILWRFKKRSNVLVNNCLYSLLLQVGVFS